MAWLETKGTVYRIRFRFGGSKHLLSLETRNRLEAETVLGRFKANLRLIDQGAMTPPPDGTDIGSFIISQGEITGRPSQIVRPVQPTLAMLFESYLNDFPKGAKEASTWKTETIHVTHLRRLLDCRMPRVDVTPKTLQSYIEARTSEAGQRKRTVSRDTIKKELGTLSSIWNKWGIPQGLVTTPPPLVNLTYPKGRSKPPFQTREQINRQIASQKLTPEAQAELWQCLFLTLAETEAFLDFVRAANRPAYVYPMIMFVAHTGARRSEVRRSLVSDFDFTNKTVLIREKKKDNSKVETYRSVPLSPRLEEAMSRWFEQHHGGSQTICTPSERGITDHYATKILLAAIRRSEWSILPGWHCLRHSFISNCAARGVDQRMIDHWVGHTTEAMRRRYSHLLPAVSQAAMKTVFG